MYMCVRLLFWCSLEKVKSFDVPSKMYSASLHPSRQCFVAGGEDFKVAKFDFEDGKELGESPAI